MILKKVHEQIAMHSSLDSGYNLSICRMVSGEAIRDCSQETVHTLIREHDLEKQREIKQGTIFGSAIES